MLQVNKRIYTVSCVHVFVVIMDSKRDILLGPGGPGRPLSPFSPLAPDVEQLAPSLGDKMGKQATICYL